MKVIELFAGVGGFRVGFERASENFEFVWSNQWEPSTKKQHASEVYVNQFGKLNHSNEDIGKVESYMIPEHDLLVGGFPCFVAGTIVLTKNGYKNIEDIKEGEYVLTHTNSWKKVIATMNQEVIKEATIKFYGSLPIKTTINHPFYCIERKTKYNKKYKEEGIPSRTYSFSKKAKWINAKDLKQNVHYVGVNINQESKKINFGIKDLSKNIDISILKYKELPWGNKDFYWFLGRYLADGWYQEIKRNERKNSFVHKTILCCNKNEVFEVEKKLNTLNLNYTKSEERTVVKYIFSNLLLTEFVKNLVNMLMVSLYLRKFKTCLLIN